MHQMKLVDFNVTILDSDEESRVMDILRSEADRFCEVVRDMTFNQRDGGPSVDGASMFDVAQAFEFAILEVTLEKNMKITPGYILNLDRLITKQPDYFELHYLKGKVLLFAMLARERFLIENRDTINQNPELILMKKGIIEAYQVVEESCYRALTLFNAFTQRSSCQALSCYRFQIEGLLATYYRRHASLIARITSPISAQDPELEEILRLAGRSVDIHRNILSNGIFMDLKEAAKTLANLANSLKFFGSNHSRIALQYYQQANELLGNEPNILEGIEFYQESISDDEK